jgi:hypothetical protein
MWPMSLWDADLEGLAGQQPYDRFHGIGRLVRQHLPWVYTLFIQLLYIKSIAKAITKCHKVISEIILVTRTTTTLTDIAEFANPAELTRACVADLLQCEFSSH